MREAQRLWLSASTWQKMDSQGCVQTMRCSDHVPDAKIEQATEIDLNRRKSRSHAQRLAFHGLVHAHKWACWERCHPGRLAVLSHAPGSEVVRQIQPQRVVHGRPQWQPDPYGT